MTQEIAILGEVLVTDKFTCQFNTTLNFLLVNSPKSQLIFESLLNKVALKNLALHVNFLAATQETKIEDKEVLAFCAINNGDTQRNLNSTLIYKSKDSKESWLDLNSGIFTVPKSGKLILLAQNEPTQIIHVTLNLSHI